MPAKEEKNTVNRGDCQTPHRRLFASSAAKDLIVIFALSVIVFILSYFFNVFYALVSLFRNDQNAMLWIDEIITLFVVLSLGFAVFSFRRWKESKKEAGCRIKLQQELLEAAETKATVERIISKQLRSDMEDMKSTVNDIYRLLTAQRKGIP